MEASVESFRKAVDEQLICAICLGHLKEPKLLPCLHAFCKKCIQLIVNKHHSLTCPTCRKEIFSSCKGEDVDQLPDDFFKNSLLDAFNTFQDHSKCCAQCVEVDSENSTYCKECELFLCEFHKDEHQKSPYTKAHVLTTSIVKKNSERNCKEHEKPIEYVCRTCEKDICEECTSGVHSTHTYLFVHDWSPEFQEDAEKALEQTKTRMEEILRSLSFVESMRASMTAKTQKVDDEITSSFEELHELLRRREQELHDQFHATVDPNLAIVESHRHQLNEHRTIIEKGYNIAVDSLQFGHREQVRAVQELLTQNLKKTTPPTDIEVPEEDISYSCLPLESLKKDLLSLGRLHNSSPYGPCCRAKGEGLVNAIIGEVTSFFVETRDREGNFCPKKDTAVRVTIKGLNPKIIYLENGVFEVAYIPSFPGNVQVHVTVNGLPIQGSPFHVNVIQQKKLGSMNLQLNGPIRFHQGPDTGRGYKLLVKKTFTLVKVRARMLYDGTDEVTTYLCDDAYLAKCSSTSWKAVGDNWHEAELNQVLEAGKVFYVWVLRRGKTGLAYVNGNFAKRNVNEFLEVENKSTITERTARTTTAFTPSENSSSVAITLLYSL